MHCLSVHLSLSLIIHPIAGADPGGGGAPGAPTPLKLEKILFFGVKS
jgi:hypothetical protein